MMRCEKCGKELNIKMEYVGAPITIEREYYCSCGAIYKGLPGQKLKEVTIA